MKISKQLKELKKRINSLYPEQKFAFDEMQKKLKLQLCYNCGFGKGYIMSTDILNSIVNRIQKKEEPRIHALLSHRLALNEQHISELFRVHKKLFGKVAFVFLGSEGGLNKDDEDKELNEAIRLFNDTLPYAKRLAKVPYIKTTNSRELLEFKRTHSDKDIIVISTYHSCNLLSHPEIYVDTIHCDEAHELAVDFNTGVKPDSHIQKFLSIKFRRSIFYTATPIDCSEDPKNTFYMNNYAIYGSRLTMSHIEAVEKGYVLPTVVEVMFPNSFNANFNTEHGSIENKAYFCYRAFERNSEWLNEVSAYPDLIKSKILIRCSSVEKDMWPIFNSIKKYLPQDVYLFACASEDSNGNKINENCIYKNGEYLSYNKNGFKPKDGKLSRKAYISALQSLKDTDMAIVLHHDTISEGINVPTFTGFVPSTDTLMSFLKLYQNIGRVIRLLLKDKNLLKDGKLEVFGEGWIKPAAQIIIPYWSNVSQKATENIVGIIIKLETDLGAKLSTEMPYGSNIATGYGQEPEVTHRIRTDSRTEITPEIEFMLAYSREQEMKKRMKLNIELDKMTLSEQLDFLNSL
jgi:hypothetical protein